jgi:hypothetical protein
MTVLEMTYEFEKLLQLMDKSFQMEERPDTETVVHFLNLAQNRLLAEKYFSQPSIKENIAFINNKLDELQEIIETASISSPTGYTVNYASSITLPADFLYYVNSDAQITRATVEPIVSSEFVPTEYIDYANVNRVTTTSFNIPILLKPAVTLLDKNQILVFYDKYTTLTALFLVYLRDPKTMVISSPGGGQVTTCELATFYHTEIVKIAVDLFVIEYKLRLTKTSPK